MHISQQRLLFFLLTALPASLSQRVLRAPGGDPDGIVLPDPDPSPPQFLTCHTYSMSKSDVSYNTPEIDEGVMKWGMHALQWRGYNHIADHRPGSGTFDAVLANAMDPPGEDSGMDGPDQVFKHVSCHGAKRLNELESSGIFKTDGVPTDPKGSWECVEEGDPKAAAILGAMNMYAWNTPTYVDLTIRCADFPNPGLISPSHCDPFGPNPNPIVSEAVVMREITLCAEGSKPPHIVCNWDQGAQGEVGPCESFLALENIKVGIFEISPGGYASHNLYGRDYAGNLEIWERNYIEAMNRMDIPKVLNQLVFDSGRH